MKTFFDPDKSYAWSLDANQCERELSAAISPIFDKWVEAGYSPREIAHILTGLATAEEAFRCVKMGMAARAKARADKEEGK